MVGIIPFKKFGRLLVNEEADVITVYRRIHWDRREPEHDYRICLKLITHLKYYYSVAYNYVRNIPFYCDIKVQSLYIQYHWQYHGSINQLCVQQNNTNN